MPLKRRVVGSIPTWGTSLTYGDFVVKITVPAQKPRAKWLNDILLSKRSERHADPKNLSRQAQKLQTRKELEKLS
jgi:(p)ppGpp synthase/HD superfamily hydrolase